MEARAKGHEPGAWIQKLLGLQFDGPARALVDGETAWDVPIAEDSNGWTILWMRPVNAVREWTAR